METSYNTIKKQLEKLINSNFITIDEISFLIKTHPNNVKRRLKNQNWRNDEVIILRENKLII
jgi:hypothetical protein